MSKNCKMSINTPSDVLARMQETAEKAAKGIGDVEEMQVASHRGSNSRGESPPRRLLGIPD
jgi:hypothetical protein